MKMSRYTEEQIIGILKQHEAGIKAAELCREHRVSKATFYNWRSKYGGLDMTETQLLRQMEDENRRLKQLVADLSLDREALKAVIRKNGWSVPA
jgi:putative transposase